MPLIQELTPRGDREHHLNIKSQDAAGERKIGPRKNTKTHKKQLRENFAGDRRTRQRPAYGEGMQQSFRASGLLFSFFFVICVSSRPFLFCAN
jgi:hypothetical protein